MNNVDRRAAASGAVATSRPVPLWSLRSRGWGVQWTVLVAVSAVFTVLFETMNLPAALMLGPMVAAMLAAGCETSVGVAVPLFRISQSVIGCLMARSISAGIVVTLARDWPLFVLATVSVIMAASLVGWLLAWLKVLPGNTAVWGTSPGGASVMTLMSESFGADMRLVAFMQYSRMVMVSGVASIIASFWSPGQHLSIAGLTWFPPLSPTAFGGTLALTALGTLVGPLLGTPAGPLLLSFCLGAVGHATGLIEIELPLWLLAGCYALFGWSIGLRFNREILLHVAHLLPRILASIVLLIGVCAGLGVLLSWAAGVDEMTAYLAMSPGGTDSVAIIASSVPVDTQFVMSLQAARFVLVMFMAPGLAKLIVRRLR
jgi:hypothetical protein